MLSSKANQPSRSKGTQDRHYSEPGVVHYVNGQNNGIRIALPYQQFLVTIMPFVLLIGLLTFSFSQSLNLFQGPAGPQVTARLSSTPLPFRFIKDIEFARIGEQSLLLDLYLPERDRPVPVIVWIHGGAFVGGDKRQAWRYAPTFAQAGYAVASINYRLLPATYPSQIHDVKGAIRFLRAHAGQFGLDPLRLALLGTSAGGLLACQVGVSCGNLAWEGTVGGHLDQSSCVQAVINCFGSFSYENIPAGRVAENKLRRMGRLLNCDIYNDTCFARLKEMAPEFQIDHTDPPFLILHGANDLTVPVSNSRQFANKLRAAGVPTELIIDPLMGHDARITMAYFPQIHSFLLRHLGP